MIGIRVDVRPGLAAALTRLDEPWRSCDLEFLTDTGLAHTHVRLVGRQAIARIPKQSQMNLAPVDNLAYQAACFSRAAASGHVPALLAVLPPSADLPRGALLVEEISGHPPSLPHDLIAIAEALASIHALKPVPAEQRAPLIASPDPLVALLGEIGVQAEFLAPAALEQGSLKCLHQELERLRALCKQPSRPAISLIAFDAHPGNFIIRAEGDAVLVDLEKCRYSFAPLDLAHATLYTSTTWDADHRATLTPQQVASAYAAWSNVFGPEAAAMRRWHVPLRRAMWLWSITWCAKWRVSSRAPATTGFAGEDWSTERSTPELITHVRERVDHYLGKAAIERVRAEFDALDDALKADVSWPPIRSP